MLLVLVPLAFILLSVGELVGSLALALAFDVFAFVVIAIRENRLTHPVTFSLEHFSLILSAAGEGIIAYPYLLGLKA